MNYTKQQISDLINTFGISKAAKKLKVNFNRLKDFAKENNIEYQHKKGGRKPNIELIKIK